MMQSTCNYDVNLCLAYAHVYARMILLNYILNIDSPAFNVHNYIIYVLMKCN